MSKFFKDKRKFGVTLAAVFLAITLGIGSFAVLMRDPSRLVMGKDTQEQEAAEQEPSDAEPDENKEEPEPQEQEPAGPEFTGFNAPGEMRGTFLVPGVDFLKSSDTSEATLKADIAKALSAAKDLTFNTVIVDTVYAEQVIYQTRDSNELSSDFDILDYILRAARDEGMYTYAIFDASLYESSRSVVTALAVGAGSSNKLAANLAEFVEQYDLDGVLIDGYQNEQQERSYATYLSSGGAIGFHNYMQQSPSAVVKTAADTVRGANPNVQVGLLADAVWENQSANELGSATNATFTALSGANADTKGFVERGYVDFVAVKAYTTTESQSVPFGEVVTWWADVARENDIPLYVVHASAKLFTQEAGWGTPDQLIKQIDNVSSVGGVRGSIFNNLQTIASNNQNVATNLKKLYEGEVDAAQILTKLEMTKPAQSTYTTADPQVTFTGASDPNEKVTINGDTIETDASGYFTIQKKLGVGLNTFVIKHKDKEITYNITRKIEVLKSASPMQNITTDGGMTITISALAYEDANVYAVVNGQTVRMTEDDAMLESEQDRDGFFRTFTGEYTVPAATSSVQNLGKITVYAEFEGEKGSIAAGSITVNKKAQLADGVPVRVTASQAMTYPANTLNNIPDEKCFPLPAGAMDYAVGDEVTYTSGGKTYTYYVLASGLRVESKDITAISDDYPGNNTISGLTVKAEGGYTYVSLKTAQKVSYVVSYSSSAITFDMQNTTKVPADKKLTQNPLFSSANWNGSRLVLSYTRENCFWGYKGYYDEDGNLVLRFRNPPGSLSGARIAIDPGHGGGDRGAEGFLSDYPESVINKAIAQAVAEELESRGATVYLMNNNGIQKEQRRMAAEQLNPDLLVSIHNNSAPNINAVGTEVYYFYPFSKTLAANASSAVSGALNTTNRGAKWSYYHVTLSSQMPSVLVECGFLTNKGEYEKLLKSKNHDKIAVGIADSLASTIKSKNTGVSASGTESVGNASEIKDTGEEGGEGSVTGGSAGKKKIDSIDMNSSIELTVGGTTMLWPEFDPVDANDDAWTWTSSNTSVATVDANGLVTGVKKGEARITVKTSNGLSVRCDVTVGSIDKFKVESIELNETSLVLEKGDAFILRPIIEPYDATNQVVTWKSSSSSIVSVSATGKVTGLKAGSCIITATTKDGSKRATCEVTITDAGTTASSSNISDSGERLSSDDEIYFSEEEVTINPGTSLRLEVVTDRASVVRGSDLTWKSDDTSIVTVDSKGVVTGKKEGEALITASAKGHDTLECWVIVTKEKFKVTGVSLEESNIEVGRGETYKLVAMFSPANATNRQVTWSSKNERIAKVDQNGVVTGVNVGETTITVKTKDGSKTATAKVKVTRDSSSGDKVSSIYILYDGAEYTTLDELSVGDEDWFELDWNGDGDAPEVTWRSSSSSTISVDEDGYFICKKRGTATITVTLKSDSSVRATLKVVIE